MGQRRKRLIVQADLTSEEDQVFLAWVKEKLRRRRLAEEIREGLWRQYAASTGQVVEAYAGYSGELNSPVEAPIRPSERPDERGWGPSTINKLQKLVQSF